MSVPRDEDRARAVSTSWVVTAAVLVPILYVLSIGPAVAFLNFLGPVAPDGLERVFMFLYYPVILLHEYTPLEQPLDWWVDLWT